MSTRYAHLIRRVNFYPPFLGMGIRVRSLTADGRRFEVELRERWYNRNLFGTHFGGSLYTMSDPFYVFIVTLNLGDGYVVWDKSAAIDFLKPARGTVLGVFEITRERLAEMRVIADTQGPGTYHFETELRDTSGTAVARVRKELYVRARRPAPAPGSASP